MINLKTKYKIIFAIALLVYLCLLPLLHNIIQMTNGCFNIYDFGIYQQAIYELARFESWNPYITVRNIFIFHEHFDPIIYLAIPFAKLSNFNPLSLLVFEWLFYFAILLFITFEFRNKKPIEEILFYIFIISASRSILSALIYAIHPATWAIAPLFFLLYFLYQNNRLGIILTSISLFFFKETFAFGLLLFSFYFLRKETWKTFVILFITSLFFVLFELKLRKIWLGNTYQYGNQYLGDFLKDPSYFFKTFDYKSCLKVFIPYLIPLYLLVKRDSSSFKQFFQSKIFGVFLLILPMFTIHFIINRFYSHHASQFGIILSAAIIFSGIYRELKNQKVLFYLTIILFLSTSSSLVTKMTKLVITQKNKNCTLSLEKRESIKSLQDIFQNLNSSKMVLWSTGGIAVNILEPGMQIYQYHHHEPQEFYTHLLLEINRSGDAFPLNHMEVDALLNRCKVYSSEVLLYNHIFYFASGKYPYHCIRP